MTRPTRANQDIVLKTDFLPAKTRRLFERLAGDPLLEGFTLIGGSALALQIGHRLSEDLDLNLFGQALPVRRLNSLLQNLEKEGFEARSLISDAARSVFRINHGVAMDTQIQDYAIGGSKLTFVSRTSPQRLERQIEYLKDAQRVPVGGGNGFDILGIDGLFAMNTLVLSDRAKSRDNFDLMVLTRDHGYTLGDMMDVIATLAGVNERDGERYKSVLTGLIPLDQNDEGFESIGLAVGLREIYGYFSKSVDAYESDLAKGLALKMKPGDA